MLVCKLWQTLLKKFCGKYRGSIPAVALPVNIRCRSRAGRSGVAPIDYYSALGRYMKMAQIASDIDDALQDAAVRVINDAGFDVEMVPSAFSYRWFPAVSCHLASMTKSSSIRSSRNLRDDTPGFRPARPCLSNTISWRLNKSLKRLLCGYGI